MMFLHIRFFRENNKQQSSILIPFLIAFSSRAAGAPLELRAHLRLSRHDLGTSEGRAVEASERLEGGGDREEKEKEPSKGSRLKAL